MIITQPLLKNITRSLDIYSICTAHGLFIKKNIISTTLQGIKTMFTSICEHVWNVVP